MKIGDTLWFVSRDEREQKAVVVDKVGRKWFVVDGDQFDRSTLRARGGTGRCYASKAAYEEQYELRLLWVSLMQELEYRRFRPPPDVTISQIKKAALLLLGIEL